MGIDYNRGRTALGFAMHTSLGSGSGPQWELTTIEGVPRWDLPERTSLGSGSGPRWELTTMRASLGSGSEP